MNCEKSLITVLSKNFLKKEKKPFENALRQIQFLSYQSRRDRLLEDFIEKQENGFE